MDFLSNITYGFSVALTPANLLCCLLGVFIGTLVGVLPGIGPVGAISLLLYYSGNNIQQSCNDHAGKNQMILRTLTIDIHDHQQQHCHI